MNISSVVDKTSSQMNASTVNNAELIAQLNTIGQLLTRYAILILVILNFVGNTLNILVFRQQKLRTNPCTTYLLFAAFYNLIWAVAAIFSRFLGTYNLDFSAQIPGLCKIRHFTFYTFSSLSVWMMALATFDRFLISSPLVKYRQLSSFKNTYLFIGTITLLLCVNYTNLFYCAGIKGKPPSSSCTSITSTICGFYNELSRVMTVAIIPGSIILVFGMGTIQHLKKLRTAVAVAPTNSAQPQNRMRKTDRELIQVRNIKKEYDIIILGCLQMLVGQIVMIFISWIPHAVERLYVVITLDVVKTPLRTAQDSLWDQITWIVSTFDSSLSFYVYLFTGGVLFKQTLREMFRCTTPTTRTTTTLITRNEPEQSLR